MTRQRLLIDLGSLGASNALGKLLWSVSLVMMMRLLGPDDYGTVVVIWSIAGLLSPLTDLGLSQLLLREGARQPGLIRVLLCRSLLARAALGLLAIVLVVVVTRSGSGPLATIGVGVLALAAAAPLLDGVFLSATALAQSERRIGLLSVWRVTSFALVPLLLLGLYRILPGLPASALAFLLASAIGLIGFFVMRGNASPATAVVAPNWRDTLALARPFLFMSVAALSYGRAEVSVIGLHGSTTDAAFYHAAYQVVLLVFSLSEVVFTAVFARLYRANADIAMLARCWTPILRSLVMLCVLALPPLWLYADEVMMLLGGDDFASAGPVLRALLPMVAVLPLAASMNFLMLLDRPEQRARIDAVCVLVTVVILLFSASLGAVWAATAASFCYGVASAVAWFSVARLGLPLPWAKDFAKAVTIVLPAACLLAFDWPSWWLGAAAFLVAALTLLYASRYLRPHDLHDLAN